MTAVVSMDTEPAPVAAANDADLAPRREPGEVFVADENVLAFHGLLLYPAKVMKVCESAPIDCTECCRCRR